MNILFVGAGGSGMGGLVKWHGELGDVAYLQDDAVSSVELLKKYPNARAFDANTKITFDRAVFSDAIAREHPLRAYAHENKIPVRSYAEELGALSEGRHVIAIAGTHGKSTTTALISWALAAAERDPLCVIGAEIKAWNSGFRFGKGPVVVEADEFKKHFLHLKPTVVLITSLETDHFDTYASDDELVQTFVEFCSQKSVQSIFIARGTLALDRLSEELAKCGRSHVRFGNEDDSIYCPRLDIANGQSHATVSVNGKNHDFKIRSVTCPHVSNLLGAIAALTHEGVPTELLSQGVSSFPGILRRLELLGKIGDVPLYSDYAHHPTAVRETLGILKKIFPEKKIGVIFEPHERLRTSTLRDGYQTAFANADAIGLLPVYDPIGRRRPDISDAAVLISPSGDATQLSDYDAAFTWAKNFATKTKESHSNVLKNIGINRDGKIIVIMGAGPIDGAFRKFITR
jgi:UDP-N-acetylmuramate--alanine ligase